MLRKIWRLCFFIRHHTLSNMRDYMHRKLVLWVWRGIIVFLYTWNYIIFIQIAEHFHGFCWVCCVPFCTLYIPSHKYPLDIWMLQLVRVSCVIFCVHYLDGLVHLVLHLFPNLCPICDVRNASKLLEQTNNLRFSSVESLKQDLSTVCSYHIISHAFTRVCTCEILLYKECFELCNSI